MKYNEYTIPVEDVVDEAPMGLVKTGLTKLASKMPGSIGAKATGALQTGANANAMYKEFFTYLGQKGLKPTTGSMSSFLQSKGVSPDVIKKYVVAPSGSTAQYPQGGASGAQEPAASTAPPVQAPAEEPPSGEAPPVQAPAKGAGFNVKLPQKPAAQAPAPQQAAPEPQQAEPQAATAPAAPAQSQASDWAARRNAKWQQKSDAKTKGVHTITKPGAPVNEEMRLQKLLSKITKRL